MLSGTPPTHPFFPSPLAFLSSWRTLLFARWHSSVILHTRLLNHARIVSASAQTRMLSLNLEYEMSDPRRFGLASTPSHAPNPPFVRLSVPNPVCLSLNVKLNLTAR
ncbi:hypothetical protein MSAN_00504400 [Mycena sanguinolenta]|uniref:Uncharacterized protein n=1 Tax=Mycena sanguinolenta TaxID=230812 RepID=A0A8H7DIW2_9AGAR|nr:hypothetical protein MSAN_00504400 [Mycena sanguinolenta]